MNKPWTGPEQSEKDMVLPEGKTCAKCIHFSNCNLLLGGNIAENITCDWAPSRFVEDKMSHDVDKWIFELKDAGWARHATISTIWVSPWGAWYRGPYKAWCVMKGVPCKVDSKK